MSAREKLDPREPVSPGQVAEALRRLAPFGDPGFVKLLIEEAQLHSSKNYDYVGRTAIPLGNFHRRAKILSLYPGLNFGDPVILVMTDILKQLDAALQAKSVGFRPQIETLRSRLLDCAVYAKLAILLEEVLCDRRGAS